MPHPPSPKNINMWMKGRMIFSSQHAKLYNIPFNLDKLLTVSDRCHDTSGTNSIKDQNFSHLPSADKAFVPPMYSNI